MRHILMRAVLLAAACTPLGDAFAVPVDIAYTAIVTSNHGNGTDGVFPPGTSISVSVQVDSESLLTGLFMPASGSAETIGAPNLSLTVDRAGSGELFAVPGATARVYSFRGDGPQFPADGDPPSLDIWQWTSASLYLPPTDDLDTLLALTLDDVNSLIAAFGSMRILSFTHEIPNGAEFERASTSQLYSFSISRADVPEPTSTLLVGLSIALLAAARRRRA